MALYRVTPGRIQSLPYYLPPKKLGRFSIDHKILKAGSKQTIVSMRNAIFMGLKPTAIVLTEDVTIHQLKDKSCGMWMTSMFQEIEQHSRQLNRFQGDVLIGGLGLGLAVALLQQHPKGVKSITVVEKSRSIISMIEPHIPRYCNVRIVNSDLFKFLKKAQSTGTKFDYAFYDIWQPTGESMVKKFTLPLREASIGVVKQSNIEQWNEDEMIGQVQMSIQSWTMMRKEQSFPTYNGTSNTYWNWIRHCGHNPDMESAGEFIRSLKDAEEYQLKWKQWEGEAQ